MVPFHAAVAFASPAPVAPLIDEQTTIEVNRNWRGLGVGYDNGLWGSAYGQSIKLDVPFGPRVGQFLGVRVRGVMVHVAEEPVGLAGLELFGRTPVWGGIVRAYGGGGAWYGGAFDQEEPSVAWGGHFGAEFALTRRNSFTFEVGGQAGADELGRDSGASVMAGTTVYFGGLGKQ